VAGALEANPAVLRGQQTIESARGQLLVQQEAFATRLTAVGDAFRDPEWNPAPTGPLQQSSAVERARWTSSLAKPFRFGPTLEMGIGVDRMSPPEATGTTRLALSVPLIRGAWGTGAAPAREEAALADLEASSLGQRHTLSEVMVSAADAYWSYLAARRRLAALEASERRTEVMVDLTEVLVQADERALMDLSQARGHLASRRAARIEGERAVYEQWQRLLLVLGRSPLEGATPPETGTPFPQPVSLDAAESARLLDTAVQRRWDMMAASQVERASRSLVDAARSDLRPRLDLKVQAVYGGTSRTGYFGSLYRDVPGTEFQASLSFELPVSNNGARGRLLQSTALHDQRRIAREDLARRIAAGVRIAAEAMRLSALSLRESQHAVELLRTTVDAERRKFQMGVSTLFDVIQAEDSLTSATLAEIDGLRAHATAIAALRFETGTLVEGDSPPAAVVADRLMSLPQ
jgi:outer membrane protein